MQALGSMAAAHLVVLLGLLHMRLLQRWLASIRFSAKKHKRLLVTFPPSVENDLRYWGSPQHLLQGTSLGRISLESVWLRECFFQAYRCRIGAGESRLDVLGVGSGGGELDVQLLSLLQSTFPAVPITADIVEGSTQLTEFKALVAKTTNLQKIPFTWHFMRSESYEREVKANRGMKTFDLIYMVHMIGYVDNLADTIKFYHSLLKNNGRLMIIVSTANSGWDTLWKTYKEELCVGHITEYCASVDVTACLKSLGLKYEEHAIPITADISECFDPSSQTGEQLLSFFTMKDHFHQSFTLEIRAGMLDLLRNKCSTEKDVKLFFNADSSCILVYA